MNGGAHIIKNKQYEWGGGPHCKHCIPVYHHFGQKEAGIVYASNIFQVGSFYYTVEGKQLGFFVVHPITGYMMAMVYLHFGRFTKCIWVHQCPCGKNR